MVAQNDGTQLLAPILADRGRGVWSAARARLESYAVLTTGREKTFDRLVFTAAQLLRAPIVAIALDDGERLWLKARVGLDAHQLPRDAVCQARPEGNGPLIVEDAARDSRFARNPLVTEPPRVRFYAETPLITPDRLRVGSLLVLDRVPRTLAGRQTAMLLRLAESTVAPLEMRRVS